MTKRFLLSAMVAWAVAHPASVSAQVHAGVPIEALTPPSMQLTDIQLSAVADQPVRLAFSSTGPGEGRVFLDVYVAPDQAGALAALEIHRASVVAPLAPHPGLGDRAFGETDLIAFVRDNVFVSLHSAQGDDLSAWAVALDEVIQRAPLGQARASARLLRLPVVNPGQAPVAFIFSADVLEATVLAHGSAVARRTRTGWALSTEAEGAARFEVRLVDRRLRQP